VSGATRNFDEVAEDSDAGAGAELGELTVDALPAGWSGDRLDRVVAMASERPRSVAARLITDGRVRLDGTVIEQRSRRCAAGERLEITHIPRPPEEVFPVADPGVDFHVVHEDDHVIVVDKPEGLVVHPGAQQPTGTLVNGLLARYPDLVGVGQPQRPGIVHRLDKATSGLLVVARTQTAYEGLVADLAAHEVLRRYSALVWGTLDDDAGVIEAPIGRSRRNRTAMAVVTNGRPARTHYSVAARFVEPDMTLLECRLETGRTHQIRVHLTALGHPVVGDDRYGGVKSSHPDLRLALHAVELEFAHPDTGAPSRHLSPLPESLTSRQRGTAA